MEIELTRLFVKVVQNGSFSKAADLLKIPKSTVSKAITRLERQTGTKLLIRTTRSQTLTPAGRVFYETCLGPIQILEDAQKSLHGQDSIVSGSVKLTAPEDLGLEIIAPVIGNLSRQHPHLFFELDLTNHVVDLVKEGFDLAVRLGKLSSSRLKVKKIGEIVLIPVASPEYLSTQPKIKHPQDLEQHDCLTISASSLKRHWKFRGKKETATVTIRSRVESNQVTGLLKMAMAGGGVAYLPRYLCLSALDEGKLVQLLPEWCSDSVSVSLVSPLSVSASARLKLVSDHLAEAIKNALR